MAYYYYKITILHYYLIVKDVFKKFLIFQTNILGMYCFACFLMFQNTIYLDPNFSILPGPQCHNFIGYANLPTHMFVIEAINAHLWKIIEFKFNSSIIATHSTTTVQQSGNHLPPFFSYLNFYFWPPNVPTRSNFPL